MIATHLVKGLVILLLAAGTSAGAEATPAGRGAAEGKVKVMMEGVAASGQASPVSVLREIGERIRGRSFSIMYGKYITFLEDSIPPALITDQTRLISIKKLRTGLFKATMEVEVAPDLEERVERLREMIQRGAGDPATAGSLILAREEAREDALKKGILATVAELYPEDSAPARMAGRVYFLGTIREDIEEGQYVILVRLKVWLVQP